MPKGRKTQHDLTVSANTDMSAAESFGKQMPDPAIMTEDQRRVTIQANANRAAGQASGAQPLVVERESFPLIEEVNAAVSNGFSDDDFLRVYDMMVVLREGARPTPIGFMKKWKMYTYINDWGRKGSVKRAEFYRDLFVHVFAALGTVGVYTHRDEPWAMRKALQESNYWQNVLDTVADKIGGRR